MEIDKKPAPVNGAKYSIKFTTFHPVLRSETSIMLRRKSNKSARSGVSKIQVMLVVDCSNNPTVLVPSGTH